MWSRPNEYLSEIRRSGKTCYPNTTKQQCECVVRQFELRGISLTDCINWECEHCYCVQEARLPRSDFNLPVEREPTNLRGKRPPCVYHGIGKVVNAHGDKKVERVAFRCRELCE